MQEDEWVQARKMKHYKETELKELDAQVRKYPVSVDTLRFICDAYRYTRKENRRLKDVLKRKIYTNGLKFLKGRDF